MKNKIYKCEVCGNIVELLYEGGGELVCCGQPMQQQSEKKEDEGAEKHVPIIEKTETGYKVKIGSVPHPMEEKHYIEWIELTAGDVSEKVFLKPGALPEAEFCITAEEVTVRCYCNIHGLWSA